MRVTIPITKENLIKFETLRERFKIKNEFNYIKIVDMFDESICIFRLDDIFQPNLKIQTLGKFMTILVPSVQIKDGFIVVVNMISGEIKF